MLVICVYIALTHSLDGICQVFPDFIRAFHSKQQEISQQVVAHCQKLKIEFRKREHLTNNIFKMDP